MGKGTIMHDALILFEQGRGDEALRRISERERTNLLPVTRDFIGAVREWSEGKREESIALCRRVAGRIPDGEELMYVARMLSAHDEGGEALVLLRQALDQGFNPYRLLLSSDRTLHAVRAHQDYHALLGAARTTYLDVRRAFIDAGGGRLLGVTTPMA